MRLLGVVPAGGTHAHLSRTVKEFGIDTSHFMCPNCHRQTPNFAGRSRGRNATPDSREDTTS